MPGVPPVIQRFFDTTNVADTAAFLACFTDDAYLNDWGSEYRGSDGIARWNETDNIGKASQLTILEVKKKGGRYEVAASVRGNGFNGEGTMAFTLRGDKIVRLEIT